MSDLRPTLNKYLADTYKEMDAATDSESLKLVHDMALGALLLSSKAGAISDEKRNELVDKLNLEYGIKWQELLKERVVEGSR